MKKLFVGILLAGSLAAMAFTACGSGQDGSGAQGAKKFEELSGTNSVYAFSAASAGMIISAQEGASSSARTARAASATLTSPAPGTTPETNPETNPGTTPETTPGTMPGDTDKLDGYMELVGSLLSDGAFGITEEASDRPEYETKTTFTYSDMEGVEHSYLMYYNSTPVADDDDRDDRDETEEEYNIDGIMLIEGDEYPIRGESENETESGESETETRLTVDLGGGSRIVVEQSLESERGEVEQEYSYSLYEANRLVERTSFEYEAEGNETEVMMTSVSEGKTDTFRFSRDVRNGKDILTLRTGSGAAAERYYVIPVESADGSISYTYERVTR